MEDKPKLQSEDVGGKVTNLPQRPAHPVLGERFNDPRGYVVEWDGANWREPASGRIA